MVYLGKSVERDMYYRAKPELFRLAEDMRKNPTVAEKILWKHIKKLRTEGFVFRRQHPLDFFIADFYCHKIKLVIEVDGDIHLNEENIRYDDSRSGELERYGIMVVRFKNEQVLYDIDSVMSEIDLIINELASPSLLGEGDAPSSLPPSQCFGGQRKLRRIKGGGEAKKQTEMKKLIFFPMHQQKRPLPGLSAVIMLITFLPVLFLFP